MMDELTEKILTAIGGFLIGTTTATIVILVTPALAQQDTKTEVFNGILNRVRIRIHTGKEPFIIDRDMRETPWSEGVKYYGKKGAPWYCAKVECSDSDDLGYTGAKSEIFWPMFYAEHNQDDGANHWGDVSVVVVDSAFAGAFTKDIVVDGKVIWTYTAGSPRGPWIHFNLVTGEVKCW